MMTLKELKKMVVVADSRERVPGFQYLRENVDVVVKEVLPQNAEVTVYANGYVVYSNGYAQTTFPLHACGDMSYEFLDGQKSKMKAAVLEEEAWYIRLFMEGEERLESNFERTLKNHCTSYSEFSEDCAALGDKKQDLLASYIEKELMDLIEKNLTEKEWDVFYRVFIEGEQVKSVSPDYKVTPQALSQLNSRTKKKLADLLIRFGYWNEKK